MSAGYARLRRLEKDIRTNYQKLSYASQGMLGNDLDKINGLLENEDRHTLSAVEAIERKLRS